MRKLCQFAVDFVKREDGPTAVEYAVMLALIIVVCITAITTLGSNANATFTSVGSAIGWGVQFQRPGFVAFLAVVVVLLFALALSKA